jgi:transcriptional antiterminator NusG
VIDEPKRGTDEQSSAEGVPIEAVAIDKVTDDEVSRADAPATEPVPQAAPLADEGADKSEQAATADVEGEEEEKEVAQWADADDQQSEQGESGAELEDDRDDVAPLEEATEEEAAPKIEQKPKDWYILKVQSNREDSIAAALQRRVKVAGLEEHFDEIIVPVEMVTEFKGGKRKVVKRKLYPGYIVVHMAINDETWFLVRETPGIGDFTGSAGRPTPMLPQEVARIVPKDEDVETEEPKLQIGVGLGDRVKINEGTFENFEGEVDNIDKTNGRVTVMINIFGRSTPVELEYWQIEKL